MDEYAKQHNYVYATAILYRIHPFLYIFAHQPHTPGEDSQAIVVVA
jgi:hypothetical protein